MSALFEARGITKRTDSETPFESSHEKPRSPDSRLNPETVTTSFVAQPAKKSNDAQRNVSGVFIGFISFRDYSAAIARAICKTVVKSLSDLCS